MSRKYFRRSWLSALSAVLIAGLGANNYGCLNTPEKKKYDYGGEVSKDTIEGEDILGDYIPELSEVLEEIREEGISEGMVLDEGVGLDEGIGGEDIIPDVYDAGDEGFDEQTEEDVFDVVDVFDVADGADAVDGVLDSGSCEVFNLYCKDKDEDGFGNPEDCVEACFEPEEGGYVLIDNDNYDCNDNKNDAWKLLIGYKDKDGDGYGAGSLEVVCSGENLPGGYSLLGTDCDDNDGMAYPGAEEKCNGLDNDCDKVIDNGGDELCDDGKFCNGKEVCLGAEGCEEGIPADCSANNWEEISVCDYKPDGNDATLDFFPGFTSECDGETDKCTEGEVSLTHSCSVEKCKPAAECDGSHDCKPTECDSLDGCVGDDYYDYTDMSNLCLPDCSCTSKICEKPVINYNDVRCIDCQTDEMCNDLDRDYCDGDLVKQDEGKCVNFKCTAESEVVKDCNLEDKDRCEGTKIIRDDYTCYEADCVSIGGSVVKNCDDGLVCNGEESCLEGGCVSGSAVDCSGNDIFGIEECGYIPDGNPSTLDYRAEFVSACGEPSGNCKEGNLGIKHSCNVEVCGAECDGTGGCIDECVGEEYYFNGKCGEECECSFEVEDCNAYDGWHETGIKKWVSAGLCTEKEQKEEEGRDYKCGLSGCEFTVLGETRWVDTGGVRNKSDGTLCEDGEFCNGVERCLDGSCVSGSAVDCSGNDISGIAECKHPSDMNDLTWDYRAWFTSDCDEFKDKCMTGDTSISHSCNVATCKAECDEINSCADNTCSVTYDDDCSGKRLVEYNGNKFLDSTTVNDSCENSCLENCLCTDCVPDCSTAPVAQEYCVLGVCAADCEAEENCPGTECDYLDGCVEGTYRDYMDRANSCLESCECSVKSCTLYSEKITDADKDGYDLECEQDCDDTDENVWRELTGYPDLDKDGYTLADPVGGICSGESLPSGYEAAPSMLPDCDDGDSLINPGASEDLNNSGSCNVTDLDGKDNDCNGVIDENCMVQVPSGTFPMGPRNVTLTKSYDVDEFEVTNKQYEKCVEKEWCTVPSKSSSYTHPNYYGNPTFEDYPVIYVTWYQAKDYCTFAGKRLPTEAEWEFAAKGTQNNPYPWGSSEPDCSKANYNMCVGDVTKVGSYPGYGSPYGVYDMAGNVMEWCKDWADDYPTEDETDPQGPETGTEKIKRGGDFGTPSGGDYIKTFRRYSDPAGNSKKNNGFRCVKEKE